MDLRRIQYNIAESWLNELRTEDEKCYRNFVLMSDEDFAYLL